MVKQRDPQFWRHVGCRSHMNPHAPDLNWVGHAHQSCLTYHKYGYRPRGSDLFQKPPVEDGDR